MHEIASYCFISCLLIYPAEKGGVPWQFKILACFLIDPITLLRANVEIVQPELQPTCTAVWLFSKLHFMS